MRVSVEVAGWQQACCGETFAVGDDVVWQLRAVLGSDDVPADFAEDHHEGDDSTTAVAGRIARIRSIRHRWELVPGNRVWSRPVGEARFQERQRVRDREQRDEGWLVELEVDPAALPDGPAPDQVAPNPYDEWAETLDRTSRTDLGARVADLTARLRSIVGTRAVIRRDPTGCAVTVIPKAASAADVLWSLGDDGLGVSIGEGTWVLPARPASADRLERMLCAAIAGRVRVTVGEDRVAVEVTDGRARWRSSRKIDPIPKRLGRFFMGSHDLELHRRGDFTYVPW